MRTGTINGCSIKYPDEVVFCFNPNMITVNTSSDVTFVISSDSGGSGGVFDTTFDRTFTIVKRPYFSDNRDEYANYVELDISAYLQACFDINRSGGMVESKVIHVKVSISGESFSFDVTAIWGAMNIGEQFDAPRTVVHFTKYPFTVTIFDQMIKHVSPSDVPEYVKVVEDDSEDGIYLRWIDRHGFYRKGQTKINLRNMESILWKTFMGASMGITAYPEFRERLPRELKRHVRHWFLRRYSTCCFQYILLLLSICMWMRPGFRLV